MKRLNFVLPEWTRIIWVSEEAKRVWEPRISAINKAWFNVERRSVMEGIRGAAIQSFSEAEFFEVMEKIEEGSSIIPLVRSGSLGFYSSSGVPGGTGIVRAAIIRNEFVYPFLKAFRSGDDVSLAHYLGFPYCCAQFFDVVWNRERFVDTSWRMATFPNKTDETSLAFAQYHPEANILLRWTGVRAVPHLPCSFNCSGTRRLGRNLKAIFDREFPEESAWAYEMLNWPIEWSALKGIAEIKTPCFKISTRTDATGERYQVRLYGANYPKEGASGLNFPYRTMVRDPRDYSRYSPKWKDNGFNSEVGQNQAHEFIVKGLANHIGSSVADLGCGNGLLLKRLLSERKDVRAMGIDISEAKLKTARNYFPEGEFRAANLLQERMAGELTILMPGRLRDCSENDRKDILDYLWKHSKKIALYLYRDWLVKDNLQDLAHEVGFDDRWKVVAYEDAEVGQLMVLEKRETAII